MRIKKPTTFERAIQQRLGGYAFNSIVFPAGKFKEFSWKNQGFLQKSQDSLRIPLNILHLY
jgi:hypothetical protein